MTRDTLRFLDPSGTTRAVPEDTKQEPDGNEPLLPQVTSCENPDPSLLNSTDPDFFPEFRRPRPQPTIGPI